MTEFPHLDKSPVIHDTAFVADDARIMGNVTIGEAANIWYGCVLRGDVNEIRIGARSNIQDGTVIHVATKGQGSYIGADVTVGHMALLHACTVEDGAFIGMRASVLDDAVVETGAMVAAGALVTPGCCVKTGWLWAGVPAKPMRRLTEDDLAMMRWTVPHYVELANRHRAVLQSSAI